MYNTKNFDDTQGHWKAHILVEKNVQVGQVIFGKPLFSGLFVGV
jgi:hypothetical protein